MRLRSGFRSDFSTFRCSQFLKMTKMPKPCKILVVSQHYPPHCTTAGCIATIGEGLAINNQIVVLSGSPNCGLAARIAQKYSRQAVLAGSHKVVLNVQNNRLRHPDVSC